MNIIWNVNNCEFELDMEDAETVERYNSALQKLSEIDEIRTKYKDFVEMIRAYCKAFRTFYDTLFFKGASEKIFDGIKDNIRKYDEVYESLLDFIYAQRNESVNRISRINERYAPKRKKK